MRKFGTFDIPFISLKLGTHRFQFKIGKSFFDQFEFSELNNAEFDITIDLEKQSSMMIVHFELEGSVETMCDSCGEDFKLPVSFEDKVYVKFGNEESEQLDEIWVVPHHEHQLNVAKLIYEFAHLAVPTRRVHTEGKCNVNAIDQLTDFEDDSEQFTDPRWEGLRNIKKDLK
jgi:uncharacterized metal-binding protein YceD (DUF177 family)